MRLVCRSASRFVLFTGLFRVLFGSKTFSFGFSKCSKQPGRLVLREGNEPRKAVTKRVGDHTRIVQFGVRERSICYFFGYLEVSDTKKDLRNAFFSEFYEDLYLADFFFKVIFEMSFLQKASNDVEHWI